MEQSPRPLRHVALAKIASGGTATVYVGTRRTWLGGGELVALKRPHPHILDDPRQRREVLREANVAATIHHPNVVGVREVEAQGELVQLVMEYVEGAALGALIASEARRDARIPAGIALRILLDACEGLAAVHGETDVDGRMLGLVHRDVSPQNILVGVDGRARLTDFGLAKAAYTGAPSTTQGTLKGKLGYMAPEYVQRGEVDPAADVFAMGVVLWEALAGLRLFRGENEAQTLDRLLREDASPLSAIDPRLSAFDPIVAQATAKDPLHRLASAVELRDAVADAARRAGLLASADEVGAYVRASVGGALEGRRRELQRALSATRRPVTAAGAFLVAAGAAAAWALPRATQTAGPFVAASSVSASVSESGSVSASESGSASVSGSASGSMSVSASASVPAWGPGRPRAHPPASSPLPPNPYERRAPLSGQPSDRPR